MKRLTIVETVALFAVAVDLMLAVAVWRNGGDRPIAMHFAMNGEVDRFGDRTEAAIFFVFMALLCGGMVAWLGRRARQCVDNPARRKGFILGQGLTIFVTAVPTAMIAASAMGAETRPETRLIWLCLLFAGLGAFIGKMPQNALVGVRTPWSLASRRSWDHSNRLAGWLFLAVGLGGIAVILFHAPVPPWTLHFAIIAVAVIPIFESWRVWLIDPERKS